MRNIFSRIADYTSPRFSVSTLENALMACIIAFAIVMSVVVFGGDVA